MLQLLPPKFDQAIIGRCMRSGFPSTQHALGQCGPTETPGGMEYSRRYPPLPASFGPVKKSPHVLTPTRAANDYFEKLSAINGMNLTP